MTKSYAASVYSQKSTTSAKSGRSFLSFTQGATIWPIFTMIKDDDPSPDSLDEAKQGIWKNLKSWMPIKKMDNDAVTIKSSSDSIASSSNSSLGKWKKLLVLPAHYIGRQRESNKKSPTTTSLRYMDQNLTTSSIDTISLSDKAPSSSCSSSYQHHYLPGGILVNAGGGSAQDIAEQKRRRKQRRLYLMRVQQPSSHRHSISSMGTSDNSNTASSGSLNILNSNNSGRKRQVGFSDAYDYSSSSTLLSTPPDGSPTMMDNLDGDDITTTTTTKEQLWYPAPRVTFVESSPVPRFRNEPPAPPPSPPYLIVLPPDSAPTTSIINEKDSDELLQQQDPLKRHSLIADNDHSDVPTIFTTLPQHLNHQKEQQHIPNHPSHVLNQSDLRKSRLVFTSPLQRGQTITFSLKNTIPDDHIIIYKFLTSNSKLVSRHHSNTLTSSSSSLLSTATTKETLGLSTSSWSTSSIFTSGSSKSSSTRPSTTSERYFVRPSAGKMGADESHSDIMLFLNQVPSLATGEILKDKILVRWAVIQRGTQVEAWTHQLKESTRRKWLEMLLEKWPDQVVERKTRISIRFV